eukprot:XP_022260781.1 synaptogyrin-4 [Canis lupus familiaris]
MHIPESLQDLADSEAVQFLKRPKTITRIFAGVFSLIVFSSLLTDGYQNKTESSKLHCVLNGNNVACSFTVGAGLLAFFSCLTFLALDAHESRIGSTRFKTAFQLLDFILAGYLALQDLRNDTPVPYKRSLDEGGVVLTTLSPPSATSPVNTPTTGPNNLSYAGSASSPYLTTPKAPRLAMMPDN